MAIAISHAENTTVVRIDGAADICTAADLKAALLEAIAGSHEVRVDLDAVTDIDVTTYQLLWAAEFHAKQSGVRFAVTSPPPGPVKEALRDMGLAEFVGRETPNQANRRDGNS